MGEENPRLFPLPRRDPEPRGPLPDQRVALDARRSTLFRSRDRDERAEPGIGRPPNPLDARDRIRMVKAAALTIGKDRSRFRRSDSWKREQLLIGGFIQIDPRSLLLGGRRIVVFGRASFLRVCERRRHQDDEENDENGSKLVHGSPPRLKRRKERSRFSLPRASRFRSRGGGKAASGDGTPSRVSRMAMADRGWRSEVAACGAGRLLPAARTRVGTIREAPTHLALMRPNRVARTRLNLGPTARIFHPWVRHSFR